MQVRSSIIAGPRRALGKVSIVIANFNGAQLIGKCLSSLVNKTNYPNYEVIVVDNGSSDGSLEVIRDVCPSAHVIQNRINIGFARANNQGIRVALSRGTDFVLLLNNDVEVIREDWLAQLVRFLMANDEVGIVGCKLLFPDGRVESAGGYLQTDGVHTYGFGELDRGQYDDVREIDLVSGAALFVKKDVLLKAGLLDESYSPVYFEEVEFCFRARSMGFKVYYLPSAVLVHHARATTSRFPMLSYYSFHKNRLRFQLSHYPVEELVKTVPYQVATILSSLIGRAGRSWRGVSRARLFALIVRAYLENLRESPHIVRNRRPFAIIKSPCVCRDPFHNE